MKARLALLIIFFGLIGPATAQIRMPEPPRVIIPPPPPPPPPPLSVPPLGVPPLSAPICHLECVPSLCPQGQVCAPNCHQVCQ
jgi:hypothetical protein